jgi:hypothetical protein
VSVRLVLFCNHHLTSWYSNFYIRNLPGSSKLIYHSEISNLFTKLSEQYLFASISNFMYQHSKLIISIILTQKWGCACMYHNGVYLCAVLNTHGCTTNHFINITFQWHNKQQKKCGLLVCTYIAVHFMFQLSTLPHILKLGCYCKRGGESEEIDFEANREAWDTRFLTPWASGKTKLKKNKIVQCPFVNNITILLYHGHMQLAIAYTISCNNGKTGFEKLTWSIYINTHTRPWLLYI